MAAAPMPTIPSSTRIPQRSCFSMARTAPTIFITPSTKEYPAKRKTRAISVMPGQANVRMPKAMPARPRITRAHQFVASAILIETLPSRSDRSRCLSGRSGLSRRRRFDLNLTPLLLLCLQRHGHFEHTVFEFGLGLVHFGALGKGNGAVEPSVLPFGHLYATSVFLGFDLAFTLQKNGLVGNFELYIGRVDSGQFRTHLVLTVSL